MLDPTHRFPIPIVRWQKIQITGDRRFGPGHTGKLGRGSKVGRLSFSQKWINFEIQIFHHRLAINKHSDHQSDQKCYNNHSGHQVHHQRLGQGPPKWTKGHQWCLWFIWKSCVSCAEFYFQNICVLHITWYYQKVVANFRLGDRWEKNQLTWFLTKVIIVIADILKV